MMLEGKAGDPGAHRYRVRMPAGFRVEPHTHPADERITVLQGPWHLGLGESFDTSRLKALPAGSFVFIPAGTPHFISTEKEAIIQVHGVGAVSITFVSTKREGH
jgi:quercetin dioxygenase-like cupin family protein